MRLLPIQTCRLLLREARLTDLDDLHAFFSQDDAMKYWSNPPHTTLYQSQKYLDSMIASPHNGIIDFVIEMRAIAQASASTFQDPALHISSPISPPTAFLTSTRVPPISDPSSLSLPVSTHPSPCTQSKPTVIGKIGCWNGSEMGFILNTAYWGKGYASEALEAILERIFETSNTKSDVGDSPSPNLILKADVDPRNERCLRLLTAFGFGEYGRKERTFETHLGWCDSVYLDLTQERWMKRKSTEDK